MASSYESEMIPSAEQVGCGIHHLATAVGEMGRVAHDELGIIGTGFELDYAALEERRGRGNRPPRPATNTVGGIACPRCKGPLERVFTVTGEPGQVAEIGTGVMYGGLGAVFYGTINSPYCRRCGKISFGELPRADRTGWMIGSAINLVVGSVTVGLVALLISKGLPLVLERLGTR